MDDTALKNSVFGYQLEKQQLQQSFITSIMLYYLYCLLFTFTFTVQFKTDDRSYYQLLGQIL